LRHLHAVARTLERGAEKPAHRLLVLDDERQRGMQGFVHAVSGAGAGGACADSTSSGGTAGGSASRGSGMRNDVPPPGRFAARMSPPCAATMARQIARPKPTPGAPPVLSSPEPAAPR